ncbi:hypothetical protein GTY62_15290 [Streptomyces sp. SID724]|uniref:hypothetical protein n=1 Tax=Streptomyces sp. SID724 TaxID=2690324 RepID=UPI0013610B61|nr:hypothetical protein [Streptomyces sp. SID724]
MTILAPSGGGKTHLAYELLEVTARPDLPAIVFVMKPRDETVDKFTKRAKFRIVREWPPPLYSRVQTKPPGWALWPKHSFDPDVDDSRQYAIFRSAIMTSYKRGDRILFADETYSLENELPNGGLTKQLRTIHTKGRSMKCGIWSASQRAAYINRWAYQAHHLFLGHDPDDDAQKRLSEIGAAVDKRLVREIVGSLRQYQWLYIHRDSRTMCIVDP